MKTNQYQMSDVLKNAATGAVPAAGETETAAAAPGVAAAAAVRSAGLETPANTPSRISWPSRAVVTAGMPYGNKPLHFGHIGGVFVPADAFARFLCDRIGANNVRFVCGTDCFGSPINEGYRKKKEAGEFSGSIAEYVEENHAAQKKTLESYGISLSIYEGSGIGHCGEVHQIVSERFIERLYEQGFLHKRETLQFYDEQAKTFLNGRQVLGHCPVQGCKSEHGYADECDLGHQYDPADLIAPTSSITNTTPTMKPVSNWYFDLPAFSDFLKKRADELECDFEVRPIVAQTLREFLAAPIIYIKNEAEESYRAIAKKLPAHTFRPAQKGKQSFEIEFENVDARDEAREVLTKAHIRFRTGKALVPFRITGNIEWGVKAPVLEGVDGLSVWCWPESLWAPLSFTVAVNDEMGLPRESWHDFWCSDSAQVYQFIGQDNLYFYGVAQPALIEALGDWGLDTDKSHPHPIRQTKLIANHHLLFGSKKASSSGEIKPPTADELLNYYTCEQLRAHFLALGLDQKSVGFKPKPFDPNQDVRNDARIADPVLKEGTLLTNVFNRLARSCLYEAQKNFDTYMPLGVPAPCVRKRAHEVLYAYEKCMHAVELHSALSLADDFIRFANKHWASGIKAAQEAADDDARKQVLIDSFYMLRIACLLMHPMVPFGCELICDYLNFSYEEFFSWNYDFENTDELCTANEIDEARHLVRELPPRFDFFKRHESQMK